MFLYLKYLRPYQWVKNFLIFIPIISSHQINEVTLKNSILAFISFCFISSVGYIINDIFDFKSDQNHPQKKNRPYASGKVTKSESIILIIILLTLVFLTSLNLNLEFLLTVLMYLILTTIYTVYIKQINILDIITLSGFFTLRIYGGSQATDIAISIWLLAFSVFFFFSLASVKRQAEIVNALKEKRSYLIGRGYNIKNIKLITSAVLISGYISIIILIFYINSTEVIKLYKNPNFLFGCCIVLFYWISRMAFVTHKGFMHHDPIIYAFTDKQSYVCLILILLLITMSV
tara:strand:+ start:74 stop:940 length:867 start_codon:yes stop_codon:yes gene_type:complete